MARHTNLTPEQAKIRTVLFARRGMKRDEDGKIIRSKEWIEKRIARLKDKEKTFLKRLVNIKVEIKQREKELK